jgi:hypothetical protein
MPESGSSTQGAGLRKHDSRVEECDVLTRILTSTLVKSIVQRRGSRAERSPFGGESICLEITALMLHWEERAARRRVRLRFRYRAGPDHGLSVHRIQVQPEAPLMLGRWAN